MAATAHSRADEKAEFFDSPEELASKLDQVRGVWRGGERGNVACTTFPRSLAQLAEWIKGSKHFIAFTGAGIRYAHSLRCWLLHRLHMLSLYPRWPSSVSALLVAFRTFARELRVLHAELALAASSTLRHRGTQGHEHKLGGGRWRVGAAGCQGCSPGGCRPQDQEHAPSHSQRHTHGPESHA